MSVFKQLKIPVGLAPMAGVGTAEMAAKVSQSGLLGSLGMGMMSPDTIRESFAEVRKKAPGKPLHVNLFVVDESPKFTSQELDLTLKWLSEYCSKHGLGDVDLKGSLRPPYAPSFSDQFVEVLKSRPQVISFTFGLVSKEQISMCHAQGIEVWGTATNPEEAGLWKALGVDAVILQGLEAGGHRGSLASSDIPSAIPLEELLLTTQRQHDTLPLIVAGGIMSGKDVAKYIKLGAAGVQIGTLFMGASDSSVNPGMHRALYGELGDKTALTRSFTGRWARGIENDFIRTGKDQKVLPYPVLNKLTQPLRKAAVEQEDMQSTSLWAGTGFRLCRNQPIEVIIDDLEKEYSKYR